MSARKKDSCLIEILDEQDFFQVDTERIKLLCEKIIEDFQIRSGRLGIVLVDDDTIRQYNRDFLAHDYVTDVISFPIEQRLGEAHLEAEILACTQVAQQRASEFGWTQEEEILLYIVHGILHVVGFDDTTTENRTEMRLKEREYLARIGINVPDWDFTDWDFTDRESEEDKSP